MNENYSLLFANLWINLKPWITFNVVVTVVFSYFTSRAIYRLTLHPLASFPGPKLCAISHLPYARTLLSGHMHHDLKRLHEIYGPVVRNTPTSLSFSTMRAHDDIHNHNAKKPPFVKNSFFDGVAFKNNNSRSMLTIRDPDEHARVRKIFSGSFSPQALEKQEPAIQSHMNELVEQIRKHEARHQGVEMNEYLKYVGFDIAGELSFGESFGATRSGTSHFWVERTTDMFFTIIIFDIMRRYFFLNSLVKLIAIIVMGFNPATWQMRKYSRTQMKKRLAREPAILQQEDLFSSVIKNGRSDFTLEQLTIHASSFILAGSQSTGAALTSIFYNLLKNPEVCKMLTEEIRSSFQTNDEIRLKNSELPYLCAVIEEAMRILPVFPVASYRDSPGGMVDSVYVTKGTEVSVCPWALLHSPEIFHDPESFMPERWLEKNHTDTLAASKPFSAGPRNCVGRYLARFEMRLLLCKVLFNFDMEPQDPVEFGKVDWIREKRNYIFWEKNPLLVKFNSRTN